MYLFPDIVTLFIGLNKYNNDRRGVLFCLRDDIEAYYSKKDLLELKSRFCGIPIAQTDTFLQSKSGKYICRHRESVLNEIWNEYSKYKVIITDRYHGTIFSLIASTPVVVLSSADHKLSSGVKWFTDTPFKEYVSFASSLNEAYTMAMQYLNTAKDYHLPPVFNEKYSKELVYIMKKELNID